MTSVYCLTRQNCSRSQTATRFAFWTAAGGIVCGTALLISGSVDTYIGFLYNTNTSTFTTIIYPGATRTVVQGINDGGEVAGFYTLAGVTSGFTYESGVYTPFNYPGSNLTELFGISNNGTISGLYTCPSARAIPTPRSTRLPRRTARSSRRCRVRRPSLAPWFCSGAD